MCVLFNILLHFILASICKCNATKLINQTAVAHNGNIDITVESNLL